MLWLDFLFRLKLNPGMEIIEKQEQNELRTSCMHAKIFFSGSVLFLLLFLLILTHTPDLTLSHSTAFPLGPSPHSSPTKIIFMKHKEQT